MVAAGLPALDLWTLFVENVFGSFWMSVFGLMFIFAVILLLIGRLSAWSAMIFSLFFLYAMFIGYGYTMFIILIFTFLVGWSVFQILRFIGGLQWV